MSKSCDNCYWRPYLDDWCVYKINEPQECICNEHAYVCCECDDKSEYKYKDKYYCLDCLLKEFDVEEYTTTHYHIDGRPLGSDEDMSEVIENLDGNIKILD